MPQSTAGCYRSAEAGVGEPVKAGQLQMMPGTARGRPASIGPGGFTLIDITVVVMLAERLEAGHTVDAAPGRGH